MRNSFVHILFYTIVTVVAAAMQDMLPAMFGVKPPVMLTVAISLALHEADIATVSHSSKSSSIAWMVYAFIIGAASDALGCLPAGCDAGFFLLVCIALRLGSNYVGEMSRFSLGLISLLVVVPVHEAWMSAWGVAGIGAGNPFHSLLSVFPSLITGVIVFPLMPVFEKWAGLDRHSQEVLA